MTCISSEPFIVYFWSLELLLELLLNPTETSLWCILHLLLLYIYIYFYSRSWAISYVSKNEDLFKNHVPASVPLTMCGFNEFFPSTEGFLLQNEPWPIHWWSYAIMLATNNDTENPMTVSSGSIPVSHYNQSHKTYGIIVGGSRGWGDLEDWTSYTYHYIIHSIKGAKQKNILACCCQFTFPIYTAGNFCKGYPCLSFSSWSCFPTVQHTVFWDLSCWFLAATDKGIELGVMESCIFRILCNRWPE